MPDRTLTAYQLGSAIARGLPEPLAQAASRAVALGASQALRDRREIVEGNLRRVYGSRLSGFAMRRAVQRTFDSYARYWAESFRLPKVSVAELDAGFTYEGWVNIQRAVASGIGPIIALPHLGGWEWAAFWVHHVPKLPVTAVVEPQEPPELFEWFVKFRTDLGMNIVPLGPGAGSAVIKAVKDGHVVCLLCDRDIGGGGVEVEFFGAQTTLPGGPALVALRTGAPIIPAAVYFRGKGHHGVIREPVPAVRRGRLRDDVARVTQALAYELEALIRAEPEQWHLMQPNWPIEPAAG